ncbi:hypothetical protein L2E82_15908 [Cichorium intybus]|uniref:Uncharacterized protein n=1 Tax=Cichorium intybus TaxID=13427 RepID=A0ACB9F430_CICIN|nr:hypothetical protein L2E82_15908 [Cichorium intybus]
MKSTGILLSSQRQRGNPKSDAIRGRSNVSVSSQTSAASISSHDCSSKSIEIETSNTIAIESLVGGVDCDSKGRWIRELEKSHINFIGLQELEFTYSENINIKTFGIIQDSSPNTQMPMDIL